MSRRACRRRLAAILTMLLALAAAAAAQQFWYSLYEDGLRAIQKQDWAAAERLIRAARDARGAPRPGRNVLFYGGRRDDFFPDYYLAIALLRQNRPDEARRLFESVQQSNLIRPRDALYADLQGYLKESAPRLAAAPAPPAAAEPGRGAAPAPGRGAPGPDALAAAARNAEEARRRDEFEGRLTTARDQLRGGRYADAYATLDGAAAMNLDANRVDGVRREVRVAEVNAYQERTERAVHAGTLAEAEEALRLLGTADPQNSRLAGYRASVERLRNRIRMAQAEREGIQAFLAGRYDAAVRVLSTVTGSEFAVPRTHFFLACSQAAVSLLTRADGPEALSTARRTYRLARPEVNDFRRERAVVSPRILALLDPAASRERR